MADNKINLLVSLKDQASSGLDSLKGKFGSFGKMLNMTTLAIAAVGAALTKLTFDAAKTGDEFAKTSKMVGVSAQTLHKFAFAAQIGGAGMKDVATSLRIISKRVNDANNGLTTSVRAFAQAGISVRKANGQFKNAEELLLDSADAFKNLTNTTERTALAQELFGRAGTKLIPLLIEGTDNMKALMKETEELGLVFSDVESKQAEDFQDELLRMNSAFKGVALAIGKALMPIFTRFFTFMKDLIIPIIPVVSALFKGLALVLEAIVTPITIVVDLINGLGTAFGTLKSNFSTWLEDFKSWWNEDLSTEEIEARKQALDGLRQSLDLGVKPSVEGVLASMGLKTPEGGKKEGGKDGGDDSGGFFTQAFTGITEGISKAFDEWNTSITDVAAKTGQTLFQTMDATVQEIGTAFGAMITEGESFKDSMKQIWEDLKKAVVAQIAQMIAKWAVMMALTGGTGGGGGLLGMMGIRMAKGGIVQGGLKVPSFATGGITTAPTLAIIGDNPNRREAVVPLPDGRSIPVDMNGGVQSIAQLNILPNANIDQALMDKPMSFWVDLAQEKILPALNTLGQTGATTSMAFRASR